MGQALTPLPKNLISVEAWTLQASATVLPRRTEDWLVGRYLRYEGWMEGLARTEARVFSMTVRPQFWSIYGRSSRTVGRSVGRSVSLIYSPGQRLRESRY